MSTYRNDDYLRLAKGKPCMHCGSIRGVVSCHYSGRYASYLGKGGGIKCHDFCVAFLCAKCHRKFDEYEDGNDDERAALFMVMVLKSLALVIETGEVKIEVLNV